ncbi:MAG: YihY/virulence factor BrkB family protein [candidate division Zixibacteria bacterium]|nr:YihY/virulence factor BrkB family protein [candidate division Zixibacteria bacterium]NIR63875.1 YihY/virulence factor BrkB family protein [candidate division Zixibacteria bacterium]NIS15026.1 YihY/virulence factor BrkB family protein [candidate division Zixibacteria bacterium]NIS45824.1 YihY/virulence factor BrkB family protein [candidate division Zixibacteria bacterium]NIT51532.1 YihY/virulence factor BrkB family protein [candidate division Zixibacteria bacterium]
MKEFWGHYGLGLIERIGKNHVFLEASGLAFSIVVCIVPFVLIIFAVLGFVLESPTIRMEINEFIDRLIPYSDAADTVKEVVFERAQEFKVNKNVAGILGILGLLWASSRLFSSMRTILNVSYKNRLVGSIFGDVVAKMRDLAMVLLVLFYFLLATTIIPGLAALEKLTENSTILQFLHIEFVGDLIVQAASFIIITFAFFVIYYFVPQAKLPLKVIIVSALWGALFWGVAEYMFRLYINNFMSLKRIYGAYVFIIVTVFWIYYTSVVLIVGAEIGQLYRERSRKKEKEAEKEQQSEA